MMYQRDDGSGMIPADQSSHCYTNPSFCRQSEYLEDAGNNSGSSDLPPPPQFQMEDLPPPPDLQPALEYGGKENPAFHGSPEADLGIRRQQQQPQQQLQPHQRQHSVVNLNHTLSTDRYCYIDESSDQPSPPSTGFSHKRYGSLPLGNRPAAYAYRANRYEYIQDEASRSVQVQLQCQPVQQQQQQLQQVITAASAATRYEYIEQQQLQQRVCQPPPPPPIPAIQQLTPQQQQQQQLQQSLTHGVQTPVRASMRSYRNDTHYTSLGPETDEVTNDQQWNDQDGQEWNNNSRRQINTPKGRYTSIPMQEEYPPSLPERNDSSVQRNINNAATQKLHEILTTPRKPRKRSQSEALSPIKSPQQHNIVPTHRGTFTPGCSPSSAAAHRAMNSPMRNQQYQPSQYQSQQNLTPQGRTLSPRSTKGPMTSTPNKDPPSARRCLPLNEPISSGPAMLRRHLEDSQAAVYGRPSPVGRPQQGPPPRYLPPDSAAEEAMYVEHKKSGFYQGVDGAYISRTAVISPLSPPMSEANTTLVSSTDKYDRKNAPLLLVLVGILTCGLAIYLSWTQERRYYYDSAVGCGAFCALAGASRSLRRTWTGLCLAGLCVLTCAGLLLLAAKSPRAGTPVHDLTAGALCGVSLLGAALAFLALLSPRCTLGRHHRVHSWIPRFTP